VRWRIEEKELGYTDSKRCLDDVGMFSLMDAFFVKTNNKMTR
jgi:hypothetical protein